MLQLHLGDQQFYCLLRCVLYKMFHGMLRGFIYREILGLSLYDDLERHGHVDLLTVKIKVKQPQPLNLSN